VRKHCQGRFLGTRKVALRFSGAMLDRPDECASIIRMALEGGNDGTGKR
jgi:hypothetical protein